MVKTLHWLICSPTSLSPSTVPEQFYYMTRNFRHLSLCIDQQATSQQRYAIDATCHLQENPLRLIYKQLHLFSSVVLYDTATRSKHRGRFYTVGRIIIQRKCDLGSLVLFLINHVLSIESACSSRKLMSSVYWMMHTSIICKNLIVRDIIIIIL